MSDQFRHREHGSDDRDDVDDERSEDQPEDTVQNIRLESFDLGLKAQLGFADLGAKCEDVRLGREIGGQWWQARLGGA